VSQDSAVVLDVYCKPWLQLPCEDTLLESTVTKSKSLCSRNVRLARLLASRIDEHVGFRYYSYNTRMKSDLRLYRMNTPCGHRCLKYQAVLLWNNLPDHLKVSDTLVKVKAKLRLIFHQVEFNLLNLCIHDECI
jgi:hypothetical protein